MRKNCFVTIGVWVLGVALLFCGAGFTRLLSRADSISGTDHADELHGTGGDDVINGGSGSDYIFGADGNDVIYGEAGNDVLHGDAGSDTLFGGAGNDDMNGDGGDDYLDGGQGRDYFRGGAGNDVLRVDRYDYIIDGGGEGTDIITFASMDDYLQVQGNVDAIEVKILDPEGEIRSYADIEKIAYDSLAYERFNKATVEQIKKAPANGEVLIDTLTWISFHRMVYEALEDRRDLTFRIRYYYEGHLFTVTIPKDADVSALGKKTGYDGFLYLSTLFETTGETQG